MIDAFKAAREHQISLKNDQVKLAEKLITISDQVIKSREELEQVSVEFKQCEMKFIRDQATAADLEKAREAAKRAEEKHASAERLHELAVEELEKLDRDLQRAQEKIIQSRVRFATTERGVLASVLNKDAKFRSRLLEIYAAGQVETNHSSLSWPHFLSSVFNQPAPEEIKEAVAAFNKKHNLN